MIDKQKILAIVLWYMLGLVAFIRWCVRNRTNGFNAGSLYFALWAGIWGPLGFLICWACEKEFVFFKGRGSVQ